MSASSCSVTLQTLLSSVKMFDFAQELPLTSEQNLLAWRHLSAYSVHLVNAAVCIKMKLCFCLALEFDFKTLF